MNSASHGAGARAPSRLSLALLLCLLAFVLQPVPAYAHGGPGTDPEHGVSFEQRLNEQVPLDVVFRDEAGRDVPLREYFRGRPVVLTLNYYSCPNLCPIILDGIAGAMSGVSFTVGQDYDVVTVSIDPGETPDLAAEKKLHYLKLYGRREAAEGWHFLTGTTAALEQLTDAVGFHYAYDPISGEYAHPSGAIVLTPEGRIARYLYGMDFPARDLRLALVEAGQGRISSPVDVLLLTCYHYDPSIGRYSFIAEAAVKAGGALTVLALSVFLFIMWRRDLRRTRVGQGVR